MKNSLIILMLLLILTGCYQHKITMGQGAHLENTVVDEVTDRHWYALFGNVDVSAVDIDAFVKENPNCEVHIGVSFIDFVLSFFIAPFTFGSQTVRYLVPVDKDSDKGRAILEKQRKEALERAMKDQARKNKSN